MSEGIWGHSSGSNEVHAIFCIDKRINAGTFMGWMQHRCIRFKELDGCYLGETEKSFLVNAKDMQAIHTAGFTMQQDSVLYLLGVYDARDRRKAILKYQDGRPDVDLGWFGSCTEREALVEDSWTYDPTQDAWFICRKQWPQQITEDSLKTRQEIALAVGGQSR